MSSELDSSSDRKDVEDEEGSGLGGGNDTAGRLGPCSVFSTEEATRVLLVDSKYKSNARNEHRVSEMKMRRTLTYRMLNWKTRNVESRRGDVEDYDYMLSDFDEFRVKDNGGAVGYGYEVGDMVWGKVKSHPWLPGHVYIENYASIPVRKSKREGRVLVAFFGDSSYGGFLPAELIPFEQNFAEKSRQTSLRSFLTSVEEAMNELSRRRSLDLACRCRNEFNFRPSAFKGDYLVGIGVGDEPGIYSSIQINKSRDSFQPREMLSFMQQLALKPRNHHLTIEFIRNKSTVLACRNHCLRNLTRHMRRPSELRQRGSSAAYRSDDSGCI